MDTGLEYLQKSCQPPLIHRDAKTKNILLSADLDAKISDFGLMKVFANEFMTHITTQPAGTLGIWTLNTIIQPGSVRRVTCIALESYYWSL
jgi:serine/threonine protein kinase